MRLSPFSVSMASRLSPLAGLTTNLARCGRAICLFAMCAVLGDSRKPNRRAESRCHHRLGGTRVFSGPRGAAVVCCGREKRVDPWHLRLGPNGDRFSSPVAKLSWGQGFASHQINDKTPVSTASPRKCRITGESFRDEFMPTAPPSCDVGVPLTPGAEVYTHREDDRLDNLHPYLLVA